VHQLVNKKLWFLCALTLQLNIYSTGEIIGPSVTEFTDLYTTAEASWPQAVTLLACV
jgi:hypothetical protein